MIPTARLEDYVRFILKCRFDPVTGCVLWTGGTTAGQGKQARYGSFKYQGKRWAAHRWAAKFIHQQIIDSMEVDHGCRRTLCMHHLRAMPPSLNRELQWIRVEVGLEENPKLAANDDPNGAPFYDEPEWYRTLKMMARPVISTTGVSDATTGACPF